MIASTTAMIRARRPTPAPQGFIESVFEREGLIESHFSKAPGERRDLYFHVWQPLAAVVTVGNLFGVKCFRAG
jgi:hypothetical protein